MSRQSHMPPAEVLAIFREVYGDSGTQREFAADVGRGEVTVSRWMTGTTPVGEPEAVLIRLILMLHRMRVDWRAWLATHKSRNGKPLTMDDLI